MFALSLTHFELIFNTSCVKSSTKCVILSITVGNNNVNIKGFGGKMYVCYESNAII